MKKLNKKLISGYIMLLCGIILILLTALNYLFHLRMSVPPAVIGIIFVAIGMANIKKNKTEDNSK